MTDEELLELVESKPAGEFSLDEIQHLRTRLAESSELRAAFSSRLRLQTVLAEILAKIDLAPDDVLRTGNPMGSSSFRVGRWATVLLLATVIGVLLSVPALRERLVGIAGIETIDEGPPPAQRPPSKDANSAEKNATIDPPETTGEGNDTGERGDAAVDPEGPAGPSANLSEDGRQPSDPPNQPPTTTTPPAVAAATTEEANSQPADSATEPVAPPPWQATLEGEPVFALEDLVFQRFDPRTEVPQATDLQRWFDVIVGQPKGIIETRSRRGHQGAIDGILRLKAPWTDDSVFRLQLDDYKHLQIHFFAGRQGITLIYHADQPDRWAAYQTTRAAGRFTPNTWRLTADDGGRNHRTQISQGGPYQFRHRAGILIMSRGDIDLIRAPLPSLPDDVYFQGEASIGGIDWQRERRLADSDSVAVADNMENEAGGKHRDDEHPIGAVQDGPATSPVSVAASSLLVPAEPIPAARYAWQSQLPPQATFTVLPEGTVRLESNDPAKRSWATIVRPRDDLQCIDLELDNASAGAGIYLGDAANPRWVLRYVRDLRTDQLCLIARGNDDHFEQEMRPLEQSMLPCVDGRHWVRLMFGPSMVRWWLSADGRHWAEADPLRNPPLTLTQLGLHCVARRNCGLTLRQIRAVPLDAILTLADPRLRARACLATPAGSPAPPDLRTWMIQATELQPPDCSRSAWQRAMAVQTLAAGCPAPLGTALLDWLLDGRLTEPPPRQADHAWLSGRLRLLAQAALLADLYDNQARLQTWVDRYHQLGHLLARTGHGAPFSAFRAALMQAPIKTVRSIEVARPQAINEELVRRVYRGDWQATARFCRQIRFFHFDAKVPLFEWAEMAAARRTPTGIGDEPLTRLPETWRDLLIEHQSKEVYNAAAELRGLLESEAFEDAARMLSSLDPRALPGVAVDDRDDRLLASLPALLETATRRHPELGAAVAEEHGALAELRLREQIERRDARGVATVALQFPGTQAVVEAHAWLGDRALGSGWFDAALSHYRQANRTARQYTGNDLAARTTLAKVMLGLDDVAAPPRQLTELQVKLDELQAIQTARRARSQVGPLRYGINGFEGPHRHAIAPAAFAAEKKARLEGSVGQEPHRVLNGNINVHHVDWANRQLAVALDGQHVYVSNRFQVAAYDRGSGQRKWHSPQLPGRVRRAHDWSLTAMRPVLRGDRIFARQLYGDTTSLVCLDKANGQPVWNADHRQNIDIISDPLFIHDQLVCLTLARTSDLESVVRFTRFDAETGTVWDESDLVTLRNAWQRRQVGEVQLVHDHLIAVLGGVVLCCEADGRVRWVSRQILLPADEQADWVTQTFAPPLVVDGETIDAGREGSPASGSRIIVAEPGVLALQCLDASTGQRIWSRTIPDLRRTLGFHSGCLIVAGDQRLLGVDPASGNVRWQQPVGRLLNSYLCGGEHGLLVARRLPLDEKGSEFVPELLWVDGSNGRITHATQLAGLEDSDPRLGPMVVVDGKVWTFFGRGPQDATRDLVQLTPGAALQPTPPAEPIDAPPRPAGTRDLRQVVDQRLPDWQVLSDIVESKASIVPELHGEKDVLTLAARNGNPLVLGRRLDLPSGTHPRLRLAFGHDAKRAGEIEIRFRGLQVMRREINAKADPKPWKDVEVDLGRLAGQSGWLTVHARFTDGNNPVPLGWRQLDVVF